MDPTRFSRFKDAIHCIANNSFLIHDILQPLSTYRSIQFEIASTIKVLEQAEYEITREQPPTINKMAVYHSSNVILYSYILYGIIPSVYCREILIRPSTRVTTQTLRLHELFQIQLPIIMSPVSQRKFTEKVTDAEVVVFTGRYENSVGLREHFPESLFLFFGSGTNPTIIGKNTNLDQAVSSVMNGRLINSGQDCLCCNVVFVHDSLASQFLSELVSRVRQLQFGENTQLNADYGPIFYDGVVENVRHFWQRYSQFCIHHGRVDIKNKIIDPIIFKVDLDNMMPVEEFFAPVFYVVTFADDNQLDNWLLQPDQLRKAMGLSIFGEVSLSPFINRYYTVVYNQPYFEVEMGNEPFGGYGVEASYAYHHGKAYSRPLLISREVSKHYADIYSLTNIG